MDVIETAHQIADFCMEVPGKEYSVCHYLVNELRTQALTDVAKVNELVTRAIEARKAEARQFDSRRVAAAIITEGIDA